MARGRSTVRIEGMERLKEQFKQFSDNAQKEIKDHIKKSSQKIQKSAKARVPVQTGTLKRNIRRKSIDKGLTVQINAGKKAWYWYMVEHGTEKTAAQPFINPAVEENRQDYIDGMKDAIERAKSEL